MRSLSELTPTHRKLTVDSNSVSSADSWESLTFSLLHSQDLEPNL
jgi:hypothetical protein